MVRVWSLVINSMIKRYMASSRVSVLLIQSLISNLSLFQNHTRSKNPLGGGCIKQQCDKGNTSMLNLLYDNCDIS